MAFKSELRLKIKKGRLLRVDFDGLNAKGKILIAVCILSLTCGVWKVIREANSKKESTDKQTNAINTMIELRDSISLYKSEVKKASLEQVRQDTAQFNKFLNHKFIKLQESLVTKGYSLDQNWNVINSTKILSYTGIKFNGDVIGSEVNNNRVIQTNKFYLKKAKK